MNLSNRDGYKPGRIKAMFLILLGVLYILLGFYIYFSRKYLANSPWGEIIAVMFIIYGSWRTYRAIKQIQPNTMENDESVNS